MNQRIYENHDGGGADDVCDVFSAFSHDGDVCRF
jgi:hypothetical protein